ncbi:MAG: cell division protein FtsQ/DivIB [Candidatus Omnitrophica bacterium]|nr:cell division protein FtsQ/DivIB [Candidatus Omnitrophota bacterium]
MRKQGKGKKLGFNSFVKDLRGSVVKIALNFAVISVFLVIAFLLGKAYLYRSDYFRLNRVEIRETFLDQRSLVSIKSRILSSYKSKSIFALDLKAIAQALQASYPDAKDISVSLALPDKLVIKLKLRKPIAVVRGDKLYPVDEEGVIIPVADQASLKWLPVVDGVQLRPDERRAKVIKSKNMKIAIDLLRNIKDVKAVADYGVDSVNAKDTANITFYLRNGIEIRIGSDNFKERIIVLAKTLKDPRMIMGRIKYIDLRFGDAVIGPR